MALTTTTGSGTQTTTGTPQTVGSAPNNSAAKAGSVQPGTATSLLTSKQGVSLSNTPVTTVNLNGAQTTAATSAQTPNNTATSRDVNPVALGFCGLLFVAAVVLFLVTSRSAKNTT